MGSIGNFAGLFYLLKHADAGKVSAFLFLAPFFSAISGWLMLGEPIGWNIAVGGLFITLSLFLVNWPAERWKKRRDTVTANS
ncbi:DMT family transporter [Paenibacillus sp. J2TS4]|uniref:DMT family transporter n=1 Tax=Paenibacillus sp. J2TS4 TaxID=2807194 RepID=UPI0020BDFF9C|nr:DMT family transporter [Paenibacillus sp. J2TS4]